MTARLGLQPVGLAAVYRNVSAARYQAPTRLRVPTESLAYRWLGRRHIATSSKSHLARISASGDVRSRPIQNFRTVSHPS